MGRLVVRMALWLVPRSWRDAVAHDLEEEARAGRHGGVWRAWHAARAGLRLRPLVNGELVVNDLRYAVRSLSRSRWFSVGAALTFALGIGINVAVFSTVDRMLFRPLPYGAPEELAVLGEYSRGDARPSGTMSALVVSAVRRQASSIVDLATTGDAPHYAAGPNATPDLALITTSWNILRVLQVTPVLGRGFAEDDAKARHRVALLKHEVWQARFGGAADIIGKWLWDGPNRAEIVGVLPAGFIQPPTLSDPRSDGLVLDPAAFDEPSSPKAREIPPTVRLRRGLTRAAAEAELAGLTARLRQTGILPATGTAEYRLMPMREAMFGRYQNYLWLVIAAAGLVLMMCCVNLAGLLLVRGRSREHVVAMQLALGAAPARLVRTALIECLLLSALGASLALAVVGVAQESMIALLPARLARYAEHLSDTRVLLFSIGGATLSAMVAGLWPSIRAAQVDVLPILQRGPGRGSSAAGLQGRASVLVVEAAVGVLLVSGAAMTARSLIGLVRTDVGWEPSGLHCVRMSFAPPPNRDSVAHLTRYLSALDEIRGLAGVRAAGAADILPIIGAAPMTRFESGDRRGALWQVTPGFFDTMGMRVLAGRTFGSGDMHENANVAVLSERGATLLWPGRPPARAVGEVVPLVDQPARSVIGLVSDVRGGYADEPRPSMYIPVTADRFRFLMYAVRTSPNGSVPIPELRRLAQRLGADPSTVISNGMATRLANGLVDQRFRTILFGTFGLIALLLAAVGLYAMTSFEVSRRRSEMGIRLTLGALPAEVTRLMLSNAVRPIAAGLGIGILAAWWAGAFLQEFLHQVDARDPWTLAMVVAVLLVTAITAAWVPAYRAGRTDPAEVLRSQ
jgi:predicted permease